MTGLKNTMGRRTLLKGAAALGLVSAAGLPLRAQTAKKGGTLVMAAPGGSSGNTLDPRSFGSPYTAILGGTIYNTLTEVEGPEATLKPGLATAWTGADGGATWTFDLVQGATFHDGRPVRAADVIYSYGLHVAEGSKSNSRAIIGAIAEMVAESDSRLVLRLKAPNYFFPAQLSNFNLCVLPEGADPASGIGSGPFKVGRFAPGEVLEASRFDGYFKTDRAFVDKVELLVVNDPAARTSAVQSGEAHVVFLVDARSATLLQGAAGHTIHTLKGNGFNGVNMRLDAAPFDKLALRQAIKAAINREDLIQRVFNGFADLGNDHPVAPFSPYFDSAVPQWTYDPDRARALYVESGHTGPLLLQTSDAVQGGLDSAALIAEHAAAAGIEIAIQREPADSYWGNVWSKAPFHGSMWAARPTEDMIMALVAGSKSPANDTGFANETYDAAIAAARASEDVAVRKASFSSAQALLSAEGGSVIPLFVNVIEAVSTELQGYVGGTSPTFRVAEMVSFT